MRKLTSILLLAVFCFTLLGYHLIFHFQIEAAKSEMKTFLQNQKHHKDVIEFCFTNEESKQLEWENGDEFRYNHEMYDVIEKKNQNGKLIIRCIPDKKETDLLTEYQKTNQHNSNKAIIQLITTLFALPGDQSLMRPEKTIRKKFLHYSSFLQDPSFAVYPKPPDVC